MMLALLALSATLHVPLHSKVSDRGPAHPDLPRRILMIRVSQESSPGAGDFDQNILGFIRALQTTGAASDFYQYGKIGPNYGNAVPTLSSNTSQIFFVNASDGLALVVVHNNTNHEEMGQGGAAYTRWVLSGGTARVLLSDDDGEASANQDGTIFAGDDDWQQANTDGMVIGALPVGFTLLGQFVEPPQDLNGGWVAISADGTRIPLSLVPGQRVRLDVALHVQVKQSH